MALGKGKNKKELLAEAVAKAVGAGRAVDVNTVDFSDPHRPKTCLEIDFPLLPINQIAQIEGNAGKPIYQMSKWWARRRSSVFRALLLAAAMRAPEDEASAAKKVWEVYYANHQRKNPFKDLKVADIFMGGGTTIVEGSRLGMQMFGSDLNPVAWFVVKNEMAQVDPDEVRALLADIEAEVKPQIIPFYACDCPRGHKGKWTRVSTGETMDKDFDALALSPEERVDYSYEGPEIIYVFWAKHGPCNVTGCGHRTPIMTSPVMAIKTITVKAWHDYKCSNCHNEFDVEADEARMAPSEPLYVAPAEKNYAILNEKYGVICPHCGHHEQHPRIDGESLHKIKTKNKKVELSLLVHPDWLKGAPKYDSNGNEFGGSATDSAESTAAWNDERAKTLRLLEVRGELPEMVTCPETGVTFSSSEGTVPKRSNFACQAPTCGQVQDVLKSIKYSGKTGPNAAYAIQGYCPNCYEDGKSYGGRFFSPAKEVSILNAPLYEWENRQGSDLKEFYPKSELPYGFMTHMLNGGIPNHGFTHWYKMFNARQLLIHTQLLKSIVENEKFDWETREFILGAFQQYLRNQTLLTIWDISRDCLAPALSNNNFHPKSTMVENCVFPDLGRGNWKSCISGLTETLEWKQNPWEIISNSLLAVDHGFSDGLTGKSEKAFCKDTVMDIATLNCGSSTDLEKVGKETIDLVITDPPFGGLLHYSELSDFFYVWLRLALKDKYPNIFTGEYTPKTLEAVSNRARQPEDADGYYKRLLTECWKEALRVLKPGGLLAFTFHHSEDAPWVAVLESLFDAGFYLEATYPIRSDETKGEGQFGSRLIEYDIIHVCRKKLEETQRVSWARMRRMVLEDVRQIQGMLENHLQAGLTNADLQVIRRGKALEYFSKHYGKVYKSEEETMSVKEALAAINQLLDEEQNETQDAPPPLAEPITRQLLRLYFHKNKLDRAEIQKFLRGTGLAPSDFEERGWVKEIKKVVHLVSPVEIAKDWYGKHKKKLTSDYDQVMVLIGACFKDSGINAADTLRNENFKPHPSLNALLRWHIQHGISENIRHAAMVADSIYKTWEKQNPEEVKQLSLFAEE